MVDAIDTALAPFTASLKRRYPIDRTDAQRVAYGNWRIDLDRSPPVPAGEWVWWHVRHDHLQGREHSLGDALDECDRHEDENRTEDTKACPSCGARPGYLCREQCPSFGESADGYRDAFYELAAMLGLGAMPISPAEAWTTIMRPRIAAMIAEREAA